MNGKDIEQIENTFRYELGLAMKPVAATLKSLSNASVEHGEDIVGNKIEIGHLKDGAKTVSHRIWAVIIGVPTLLLVVIGALRYLAVVI